MATTEVERRRGQLAALSIAAVVIIVGAPLWWRTTETYRAWLPVSQIKELANLQLQLSADVEVVFARGTVTPEQQKKVPLTLTQDDEHVVDEDTSLRYRYETKYRTATVMEEDALNQPTAAEADLSLHRLSESPCGSLVVYVIPESSSLLPEDVDVYIGQRRTAMLRMGAPMRVGKTLEQLLSHLEPRIKQVLQVMSFSHNDITAALSDRVRLSPGNKESVADSMRAFKSSPGYEITFSLLNPDPKSHRLHWDIESAVQTYIQPLLTKLAPLANFSIDSQTLYYTMLGVNPRFDSSRSIYMLNADSLAHVINPVEARLGSNAASSNPVLNFLLYVPDAHHSPLHIHDHKKQEVPSNAFHSPRWGGIMVYNVDGFYGPEAAFPVDININMAKVMGVFLAQLRLLLGVQSSSPPPGFRVAPCSSAGLADWELDRLMWSRSVENVATATTTITSLAQLLDQIGNIVINDNIAQQVSSAVTSLQLAVAELEAGNLGFALQYSKEAILASERAFFDPSLLHLLYFPDDQKFAIYIPLFLPMCVPILLSLLKIMSEARQRRREKTKKKD
ncbi:GPI transamidase component PIG-S Phosphatidylinositol-glycan biosynthesis class S protein [Larimichthys crocea]|uniref:GPI transamidase component PIG-S Phosphatidylinositol-glycan biosynthesis class S protein n=1 Tax=Larimichthys crocea TaxID=215358 RepID=A0A6G0I7P3_LARCR|nr:GPI transamidase component PIG-S [Larimichthys crocea]KAE8287495.1 GPI transamidase component PIG-S Phosphatidylinositol-glycan biosynthesis class S protein [Larimichthys crocea]